MQRKFFTTENIVCGTARSPTMLKPGKNITKLKFCTLIGQHGRNHLNFSIMADLGLIFFYLKLKVLYII